MSFAQVGAESGWRSANTTSIQDAAKDADIDLKFTDAQGKQENQIQAIRSYIQQKVDVIAFSPVAETGWDAVLQEAEPPTSRSSSPTSQEAWLMAGAPHHTVLSTAVGLEVLEDFAEMTRTEVVSKPRTPGLGSNRLPAPCRAVSRHDFVVPQPPVDTTSSFLNHPARPASREEVPQLLGKSDE